ncbi:MFS family permease [Kitasatospora gansuensis]|uniref:MFS family permease n=1 Tax=Kitasatospora gansuensis TaxID=258050 RepID=A0A7W7WEW3_9ACTN|nr:MFS transporter [Kitasatospora gansuensis]MBB4944596.1 MFS family permease [Kitasatospora gansuensis]
MTTSPPVLRKPLFRSRAALCFFGADLLSAAARYLLMLALAVWVQQDTGSAGLAGLTMLFVTLGTLTSPLTGALVDRLPPRRALILPLLGTAAVLSTLFIGDGRPVLPVLYVVGFLYGAAGSMADSAQSVGITQLFDEERLVQANSVHQTLNRGLRVVMPLAGVGMYATAGIGLTVGTVSLLYLAAAALVTLLPLARTAAEPETFSVRGLAEDVRLGHSAIRSDALLRTIVYAAAGSLFFLNFFESVGLQMVTQGLGRPATDLALFITLQGVATIVAGVLLARYGKRAGLGRLMFGGILCFAASALLQATGVPALVVLAMLTAGAGLPMCIVAMVTTVQTRAPREQLGRVHGAMQFVIGVPQGIGIALGAWLVSVSDYRIACGTIFAGLLCTALALLTARSRPLSALARSGDDVTG